MKQALLNSNLAASLLLTAGACALTCPTALCQDYKPGDPINFGSAHKPMFGGDSSGQKILPTFGTAVQPQVAPAAAAADTPAAGAQGVPGNFLNSRSIPWRPGDPVTFGSAHRPYSPEEPPAPSANTAATTYGSGAAAPASLASPMPITAAPALAPVSADGDLREAPTTAAPPSHQARTKTPVAQSAPPGAFNQSGAPQEDAGKTRSSSNSGNIFSRALHWIFGGK